MKPPGTTLAGGVPVFGRIDANLHLTETLTKLGSLHRFYCDLVRARIWNSSGGHMTTLSIGGPFLGLNPPLHVLPLRSIGFEPLEGRLSVVVELNDWDTHSDKT